VVSGLDGQAANKQTGECGPEVPWRRATKWHHSKHPRGYLMLRPGKVLSAQLTLNDMEEPIIRKSLERGSREGSPTHPKT
jgi:hypothetical protein